MKVNLEDLLCIELYPETKKEEDALNEAVNLRQRPMPYTQPTVYWGDSDKFGAASCLIINYYGVGVWRSLP
jgi:hypothetical protein